ncbi:hypothetical protein Tco_1230871 [Tanacetum coccineum]
MGLMEQCGKAALGTMLFDEDVSGYERKDQSSALDLDVLRSNRVALDVAGEEVVGPGEVEMEMNVSNGMP